MAGGERRLLRGCYLLGVYVHELLMIFMQSGANLGFHMKDTGEIDNPTMSAREIFSAFLPTSIPTNFNFVLLLNFTSNILLKILFI